MYVSHVTVAAYAPTAACLALAISLRRASRRCLVVVLPLRPLGSSSDPLTLVLSSSARPPSLGRLTTRSSEPHVLAVVHLRDARRSRSSARPAAFLVPFVAELVGWLVERYRWRALVDQPRRRSAAPTLLAALGFQALGPDRGQRRVLRRCSALAVAADAALNSFVVASLMDILDGRPVRAAGAAFRGTSSPTVALSIALTLTIAGALRADSAWRTIALRCSRSIVAFALHAAPGRRARATQAREYANLSWGVLSLARAHARRARRARRAPQRRGRALLARHRRRRRPRPQASRARPHRRAAARHRQVRAVGPRHGARHALTEADWRGIRRHPDIGADLLRDIGVYGPVAEIVRCHHERVDGRGYPRGLTGEEIPEVAKIVAVAEVYDTLTAPDTYRTPMNSFEALRELRRVAGAQLDAELRRDARRPCWPAAARVPPRRRRRLRRRAGDGAAHQRGRDADLSAAGRARTSRRAAGATRRTRRAARP